MSYLAIKSIHILAVISWMAGLLYLPRLFVYHVDAEKGSSQSLTFQIMERRLLNAIMFPAMVVVWISGLYLAFAGGLYRDHWFEVKFLLVVLMTGVHFYLRYFQQAFARDDRQKGSRFFRILNEVPTLLMIAIVVLVVTRPF